MAETQQTDHSRMTDVLKELKSVIGNTFGEVSAGGGQSLENAFGFSVPEQDLTLVKEQLRLTEYLLQIRTLKLNELTDKTAIQESSLSGLIELFVSFCGGELRIQQLLDSVASMMSSKVAFWLERDDNVQMYSSGLTERETESIINRVLEYGEANGCLTFNDKCGCVLVFSRKTPDDKFTDYERKFGEQLSKIVFSATPVI
ncbi:hypothetical protein RsTz2092_00280 [Deferribacterales bacterium RsTz2092]